MVWMATDHLSFLNDYLINASYYSVILNIKMALFVIYRMYWCLLYIHIALMRFVCLYPAAGNAFCQAARLHMQLQNKHDSATSYVDAGNAFKKADPHGEDTDDNSQFHDNHRAHLFWISRCWGISRWIYCMRPNFWDASHYPKFVLKPNL